VNVTFCSKPEGLGEIESMLATGATFPNGRKHTASAHVDTAELLALTRTVPEIVKLKVPRRFHWPPFRRWFTLTVVEPPEWMTVYGAEVFRFDVAVHHAYTA
jgi:hypothetical protein